MAINKTITIGYGGKDYKLKMTMEVIDRLEEKLNLIQMANRLSKGDIRFSHAAKLVAAVLTEAGCEVTQEQVYSDMFGGQDIDPSIVMNVIANVLAAIFPEPRKKPETQEAAES